MVKAKLSILQLKINFNVTFRYSSLLKLSQEYLHFWYRARIYFHRSFPHASWNRAASRYLQAFRSPFIRTSTKDEKGERVPTRESQDSALGLEESVLVSGMPNGGMKRDAWVVCVLWARENEILILDSVKFCDRGTDLCVFDSFAWPL